MYTYMEKKREANLLTYMNNSPLVSVIIPVFNVVPYLREALDSVIYQTYTKLEIIIIDDGSTDGSEKICDAYAKRDRRIRLVHQQNKGLSTARNVGLNMMTGDFVAFLDSDDAFDRRMVQMMLSEMHQADIVVCGFSVHKGRKRMCPRECTHRRRVLNKEDALQEIVNGHMETAPWNKIYAKKIWEEVRFPEGYVYEGTYTIFDIFDRIEQVAMIDDQLVMHRNRPDSICNTTSLKNIQDGLYSCEHYMAFVRDHTPELFQKGQLAKLEASRVSSLMVSYIKYSTRFPDDKEGRSTVRELLIKARDKVDLKNCSLPTRIGYYPVLFCPRLSMVFLYPYQTVKRFRAVIINRRG